MFQMHSVDMLVILESGCNILHVAEGAVKPGGQQ